MYLRRGRQPWTRRLAALVVLIVAGLAVALAAACKSGGGDQSASGPAATDDPITGELTPLFLQKQVQIGDDRFALALQNEGNELVLNANVTFLFYKFEGESGALQGEVPATYVGLGTGVIDDPAVPTEEGHSAGPHTDGLEVGGYVARFSFGEAGVWGVEARGDLDGKAFQTVRTTFNVAAEGTVPALGDPAPRTEQPTLADVDDISEIDARDEPDPAMHELTVAAALEQGKPFIVAFSTPAYCTSRVCGPVMEEIVEPLHMGYVGEVNFIHIEPYDLQRARDGDGLFPVPALAEWGLQTEPWVFVIDRDGQVAGKFEGIMGYDEVDEVLSRVTFGTK